MFDIGSITTATSTQNAIELMQSDPGARLVAGGSDILVKVREGKLAGARLISIGGIKELKGITLEADGSIIIRPLTTFSEVSENEIIQTHIPTLGFATDQAGGPQLRNVGTIGGNVCNGATSADSASTLLTLNAELTLQGPDGTRILPLEDFYKGPSWVDLHDGEMLTALRIAKKDYEGFYGHYIKFAQRNAMDIATLGCAVHVKLSGDKKHIDTLRLAFGVAAPTPIRCYETEEKAAGSPLNSALFDCVSAGALSEVCPRTSWRATKEFRQQLVRELSVRALRASIEKAGGEVK